MIKIKRYFGLFLFCVLFFYSSLPLQAANRVQQTDDTVVIVIDPGHGGENQGTIENGFLEKSMTMITAQAMYDELCLYDNVEVYLTRTEDVDMDLDVRAAYAASVNADFLFSIHYNASVKHNLFGSEVWISTMAPYNAYGYQFGYQQLLTMRDMGLYLRGVKTKWNDNKTADYYGIIRESVALSIPAVIIEHCHVDESRDSSFCDTEEKLIAFGKADALSVAKYFGLKSTALGVDYSTESSLPKAEENHTVQASLQDETPPDVCIIDIAETDEATGTVTLDVTAADYDSPLIYYDYSYDGGATYSPLQMWPESDALAGTYKDTFTLTLQIPSGIQPEIILRAYNMFDASTESNKLSLLHTFRYGEDAVSEESAAAVQPTEETIQKEEKKLPGTTTFMPAVSDEVEEDAEVSFLSFLKLCLLIVITLFIFLLVSRIFAYYSRRKRRRQRRKQSGNNRNHPR